MFTNRDSKVEDNPAIVSGSFNLNPTSDGFNDMNHQSFSLEIMDNSTDSYWNYYYDNIGANGAGPSNLEMTLIDVTNGNVIYNTTAFKYDIGPDPMAKSTFEYTYEIDNLEPNTTYQVYSLNNWNLSVDSNTNPIDNEILVQEELGATLEEVTFTTNDQSYIPTPYIVDQSFTILDSTATTVYFQIKIVNDLDNSFIYENPLNVTIKDSADVSYQTTASYISKDQNGNCTYEITELSSGMPFLPGADYSVYSINNSGLAVGNGSSAIDDEILIADDLNSDGSFNTTRNAYITDEGFSIVETTKTSMQFQINVVNNEENDFVPETALNVTVKNSNGSSYQATASYVSTDGNGNYIYEINELIDGGDFTPSADYSIYSINNSGLAVGNDGSAIDDEILIEDDLNSDGNFTMVGYPYIKDGGFSITESTKTSVKFQINVVNNAENEFVPENALDVTLKDSADVSYQTTANYVSTDGSGNYTYEITELSSGVSFAPGTDYSVYSINNSGLSIIGSDHLSDDEILIASDLHSDGNFTIDGNPYIRDESFSIIETTKTSMQFQINVVNNDENEFVPENALNVTVKDSAGSSYEATANYVSTDGSGNYTYEITELSNGGVPFAPGTDYSVYSINDSGLAVGSGSSTNDDEILIVDDLHSDGNFSTIGNTYISDQGFSILNSDATSVAFQLEINDIDGTYNSKDPLSVTMKNETDDKTTVYNAALVSEEGNLYTYKISNLEAAKTYSFISLNDIDVAIGNDTSDTQTDIDLEYDLGMSTTDLEFKTDSDSYISSTNGFSIDSSSATNNSIQYTINVSGWAGIYDQEIDVKLYNNKTGAYEIHSSDFVSRNGNNYTYEINNLSETTTYDFYSLLNTGLAVGDVANGADNEIIVTSDLGIDESELSFTTLKISERLTLNILILLIILDAFAILIDTFFLIKLKIIRKKRKTLEDVNNKNKE